MGNKHSREGLATSWVGVCLRYWRKNGVAQMCASRGWGCPDGCSLFTSLFTDLFVANLPPKSMGQSIIQPGVHCSKQVHMQCTTLHPRTSYVASSVEELQKVVEENSLQQEKSSQCIENTCSVCVPSVSPLTNQLSIVGWLRGTVVYILVNQYRRLAYNGETIIMITMLIRTA